MSPRCCARRTGSPRRPPAERHHPRRPTRAGEPKMKAPTLALPGRMGITRARLVRRHGWTMGVYVLLLASLIFTVAIHPTYSAFDVESLALGALPLALAAAAQTVVVLSGGIDL